MKPIREPWTLEQPARPGFFAAALGLCLSFALAAPAAAQLPGTVWGQIFDANTGEPLEGVEIIFTNPERPTFREVHHSVRNGRFRIMISNVVTHEFAGFTVELKKEGYQTRRVGNVRIPARQESRLRDIGGHWNLTSIEDVQKQQAALLEASGAGPSPEIDLEAEARGSAIKLYNQGSDALNAGDYKTAEIMFQSALEKKPDLTQAMGGLARIYSRRGEHVRAVEYAEQVAAAGEDIENMNQILYAGYAALGQDDKAAAALALLQSTDPEKASRNLFNEAADLYNAGNIAEARTKLEQVIGFNPTHPEALNMLGLCYAAESENDKALETFRKFLELAPDHPEAATAQAMIEYFESL